MDMLRLMLESSNPFDAMVAPVINLLDSLLTPAILLVGSLGAVYCIFLGLKLAKADEPQEQQKAKGALKNAIIGFVLIFVLIVVLKVGIKPLADWVDSQHGVGKKIEMTTNS